MATFQRGITAMKMTASHKDKQTEIAEYWDHIREYEIDSSWRTHQSGDYANYRQKFESAQRREYLGSFPLSLEIEASYHCNLECPFCPRVVNMGERTVGHMSEGLWQKVLRECEDRGLKAMLMDHEAESMMNPRFFDMVEEAKKAGILDVWLHTNANMLNPEKSARLIEAGLTKINFSIDAQNEATYQILRVGGNFLRVIQNVRDFLRIKKEKQAHYLRTRVSFVEQKENLQEKNDFFGFWKNEPGINLITFQKHIDFRPFEKPDADRNLSEKELERKHASAPPFHCSLPWETPVIDTEGNMMPCGAPVRQHTKEFILGNLNSGDTIESCWNGEKMNALRELHRKGEWYKNPMCRVCVNTIRSSHGALIALKRERHQETEQPKVDS